MDRHQAYKNRAMKKFLVLGVLFLLPLVAYLFFASGVHNFAKLPVLNKGVGVNITAFKTLNDDQTLLKDKITVLGFLGNDLELKKGIAFNLNQKIYKKNHDFLDFQMVMALPYGTEAKAKDILQELAEITDVREWKFIFGTPEQLQKLFGSLRTPYKLDKHFASPYVFIIDKNKNLRGRDGSKEEREYFGYDSSSVAELNNVMTDDVKVILAEYRLALKKYKANRKN